MYWFIRWVWIILSKFFFFLSRFPREGCLATTSHSKNLWFFAYLPQNPSWYGNHHDWWLINQIRKFSIHIFTYNATAWHQIATEPKSIPIVLIVPISRPSLKEIAIYIKKQPIYVLTKQQKRDYFDQKYILTVSLNGIKYLPPYYLELKKLSGLFN